MTVLIFDTNANVVATGVVDSSNTADTDGVQFSLTQGNYKVQISAQRYETTHVVMSVMAGEISQYDVELQK